MSKKPSVENKNPPGSLDFIENSLNENSKDLKGLQNVVEDLGQQIRSIQNQIIGLNGLLDNDILQKQEKSTVEQKSSCAENIKLPIGTGSIQGNHLPNMLLKYVHWEDFEADALGAEVVVFSSLDAGNSFEVFNIKGNQIASFTGKMPETSELLKAWLSDKLGVPRIFEGIVKPR